MASSSPNSNNKSKQKKKNDTNERLEKLRQYGVDLPEIPGLPVQVIPLHCHAIKATAKLIRSREFCRQVLPPTFDCVLQQQQQQPSEDTFETGAIPAASTAHSSNRHHNSNSNSSTSRNVLDNILQRVDESSSSAAAVAQSQQEEEERVQSRQIRQSYQDGVHAWLNAIHRCVRDNSRRTTSSKHWSGHNTTTTTTTQNQQQQQHQQPNNDDDDAVTVSTHTSVPVAALQHLWESSLAADNNNSDRKVVVRRTTLHLMSKLLEKSSEARKWWFSENSIMDSNPATGSSSNNHNNKSVLMEWMDRLCDCRNNNNSHHSYPDRIQLWQQEAYLFLNYLDAKGYSDFYPTLPVAIQRLEQLAPPSVLIAATAAAANDQTIVSSEEQAVAPRAVAVNGSTTTQQQSRSMADWRRIRNGAMQHWEEMQERVNKLLRRGQTCLDILVPRIIHANTASSSNNNMENSKQSSDSQQQQQHQKKEAIQTNSMDGAKKDATIDDTNDDDVDDDDDGDEIDWEDGWEGRDEAHDINAAQMDGGGVPGDHAEAVERTLEAMRSTGGLHDGGLEISFSRTADTFATDAIMSAEKLRARERLGKVVKILCERFMPRLSLWVEALTNTDFLIETSVSSRSSATEVSSFVAMSSDMLLRRRQVLQQCSELKGEVARILASAKRLGVEAEMIPAATTAADLTANPVQRQHRPMVADLVGERQNPNLASRLARKRPLAGQDLTRGRSHRIKIKFNKR